MGAGARKPQQDCAGGLFLAAPRGSDEVGGWTLISDTPLATLIQQLGNPPEEIRSKSPDTQMISPTLFPFRETWRVYPFSLNGITSAPKKKAQGFGGGDILGFKQHVLRIPQSYLLYPNGRGEYAFWKVGGWVLRRTEGCSLSV